MANSRRRFLVPLVVAGALLMAAPVMAQVGVEPPLTATPQAECGPGSRPEPGLQGRVSREDHESGRAAEGYTCNAEMISTFKSAVIPANTIGSIAGFKVHRYVDAAGNECAYYDSSLMFPTNVADQEAGVVVLDMADPANPVNSATLRTPGMLQMHEALVISEERGILAAITATVAFAPGVLDIYDLTQDCRNPSLISSTPLPVFAHESGLSQDGQVFWAATGDRIYAIDITDMQLPRVIYQNDIGSHGINVGTDGTRTYLSNSGADGGLITLDTTEILAALGTGSTPIVEPDVVTGLLPDPATSGTPVVPVISKLDWTSRSIPQNSVPFTSKGKNYVMEVDEYGQCGNVGAARIIDMNDETQPFVISNLRLEVHNPENFDEVCGDPGARNPIQGYAAHYCHLPTRVDPTIVACSMIVSGLRVFDITDVFNPVEIAYFNAPVQSRPAFDALPDGQSPVTFEASNWAMSSPAFVPERSEIWYTDAFQGFYAVRITNGAWPTATPAVAAPTTAPTPAAAPASPAPAPTPAAPSNTGTLPVTGASQWLQVLGALMFLGGGDLVRRRRVAPR